MCTHRVSGKLYWYSSAHHCSVDSIDSIDTMIYNGLTQALKTAEVAAAAAEAYKQSQEQQQAASTKVLRQMAVPTSDEPDDAVGIDSTATGDSWAVGGFTGSQARSAATQREAGHGPPSPPGGFMSGALRTVNGAR